MLNENDIRKEVLRLLHYKFHMNMEKNKLTLKLYKTNLKLFYENEYLIINKITKNLEMPIEEFSERLLVPAMCLLLKWPY